MTIELHPYYKHKWALIIGINSYLHTSQLEYACNDADSITSVLINDIHFPEGNIVTLKNEQAFKAAILKAFDEFSHKTDIDDQIIFFFAGHGMTKTGLRGPIGYLIPADGNPENFSSLIRWDDLTRYSDQIPAKHILFIMDACYSGLALQRSISPGTQRFLSDMLQRYSRQVITAGKADETVADGGGPLGENSIFTGHLIQGLKGDAADDQGVITANNLMAYVYDQVAKDGKSNQTPHYGHFWGDGDLILKIPNGAPASDSDYLVKTVPEMPEPISQIQTANIKSYSIVNGYSEPESANFGRNTWSAKLGEDRDRTISRAFSWLSLIVEPITTQALSIDLIAEYKKLQLFKPQSDEPFYDFKRPREIKTTIDTIALLDSHSSNEELLKRYLKIDTKGNIEYADSYSIFEEYEGIRCFHYVQMVGFIWQFIFLNKQLYESYGYNDGVRLLINIVGTRDTILDDFSQEPGQGGKYWRNALTKEFGRKPHGLAMKCPNPNIQIGYQYFLRNMDFARSKELITGMVERFGLAYNHQSEPRCFNFKTGTFPWDQFLSHRESRGF